MSASGTANSTDYRLSADTLDITTNGLVAYYDFDGDANDESGNGNNGTVSNATLTTDRHGNADKAYSFNGNNSYVEVPWSGSIIVKDDITMSVWLNIKNKENDYTGSYGRIIKAPNEYYEMWTGWNSGDNYSYRRIDARSGGQGINISTDEVVQEGVWNHIVYTYTSDTLRIYVNGSEHKKMYKNYDWNRDISGSGSVYIGTYEPINPFLGSLDDIGSTTTLTASEISTLYSVESESQI